MEGIYFVVSMSEEPEVIFFSEAEAFESGFTFIDVFDDEGTKTISYKLMDEDIEHTGEEDYTLDF